MEKVKSCIICKELKPLSEFYKHSQMGDGHLNKCKECTKMHSKQRHYRKYKDDDFVDSERLRARKKYKRLNYNEKQKEWNRSRPWANSSEYKGLHKKLRNNGLIKEGDTSHHYDYNKLNCVFIMNSFDHRHIHTYLNLCNDTKCFIEKETGVLLDTLTKNIRFLDERGVNYRFIVL